MPERDHQEPCEVISRQDWLLTGNLRRPYAGIF
jgi:hypothetical protein